MILQRAFVYGRILAMIAIMRQVFRAWQLNRGGKCVCTASTAYMFIILCVQKQKNIFKFKFANLTPYDRVWFASIMP